MTPTVSSERRTATHPARTAWIWTALALACGLAAFLATDRWFSILDDETTIVTAARKPVVETVGTFWSGAGEHEHPPLSDLLLHYWLPIGGGAQWSLRLPSVLFYLIGLLMLALTARKMAGAAAFRSLLAIGLLWPFGFHFARMAGWYSFCFFLVAAATWAYIHYMETPRRLTFAAFVIAALLLVYSNYYGWAVIGCFAIDVYITRSRKQGKRLLLSTLVVLVIAYAPLWTVFVRSILGAHLRSRPVWTSRVLNAAYNFYSLFVSESVAPWFWYFSVPALFCIAASLILAVTLLSNERRRFLIYFMLLFGGLAVLEIIATKRLLFISGWLLLSFALALANAKHKRARRLLLVSLVCIAGIGWAGTVARTRYAASHFIEPWAGIADQAALSLRDGSLIVSNNLSFLFDLNYSLERLHLTPRSSVPGLVKHPRVIRVEEWKTSPRSDLSSVLLVKGVNKDLMEETKLTDEWLRSHCVLTWERTLIPDSGYALKSRFFERAGQEPFRIALERFDCSRSN